MYEMQAHGRLNQKTQQTSLRGFLLRCDDGFGCVQPWECFGHASLDEHWNACKKGREHDYPLLVQALKCTKEDARARNNGSSWWTDCIVPKSHATITDLSTQAEEAMQRGFSTWKCKVNSDSFSLIETLMQNYEDVRFRLDFNETGNHDQLRKWLVSLPNDWKARIDFIEDPFPYDLNEWNALSDSCGIAFAVDREYAEWTTQSNALPIWKPAWNQCGGIVPDQLIVTSAMDHPVGQAWAAYSAAKYAVTNLCGLRTDHLFEENAFTDVMGEWSPAWPRLEGLGMGFDQQLEDLTWTRLR